MRTTISYIIVLFFALVACKKEENGSTSVGPISTTPTISIESISSQSIQEFDDVTIRIKYLDGDGDIGTIDADEKSLFVIDSRDGIELDYHLPPITPDGNKITVEGYLNIVVEGIIVLDSQNETESLTFTVQLHDRAGNKSNLVTTLPISVSKE